MELTDEILVQKTTKSRLPEVDFNKLGFGTYVSDHMLICNYKKGPWVPPHWLYTMANQYLKG